MTPPLTDEENFYPLTMAPEGEKLSVSALSCSKSLEMRLTSLGLHVGSDLKISQRQGNDLVVLRGEMRLALGAGMAQKIMVTTRS